MLDDPRGAGITIPMVLGLWRPIRQDLERATRGGFVFQIYSLIVLSRAELDRAAEQRDLHS